MSKKVEENLVVEPVVAEPVVEMPVETAIVDTETVQSSVEVLDAGTTAIEKLSAYKVTDHSVAKNIAIGVGITVTGCAAAYGLYELVKKGIKILKDKKEKSKGNGLPHPEYEYIKNEGKDVESDRSDDGSSAKRPMGFHCDK